MYKYKHLFLVILLLCELPVLAQSPQLQLKGSHPSFTPGTIDTEVLTDIIQQKQQEVKEQVFKNTIIKTFQKHNWSKNLNNFATYHYLYDVMDELTSGKNKTVMASSVLEGSAEFSYILGLALFLETEAAIKKDTNATFSISEKVFESAMVSYNKKTIASSDRVMYFNLLMDLCYDVILHNTKYTNFDFSEDLSDPAFNKWYQSDNVYLKALNGDLKTGLSVKELKALHDEVAVKYNALMQLGNSLGSLMKTLEKLQASGEPVLKTEVQSILQQLDTMSAATLKQTLGTFSTKYSSLLSEKEKTVLSKTVMEVDADFDSVRQIVWFFADLKKKKYEDFSMTEQQYTSMRYILRKFLKLAENQVKNDVASTILQFLDNHTLISYQKNGDTNQGYIYMDVESVISSLYNSFWKKRANKGFRVYIQPIFTIGVNYASFLSPNSLSSNDNGTHSLWNMYYASEKVGFKLKIWNWGYTHSFKAGKQFDYYGKSRYWKTPPTQPTVSDVHIIAYGSGLLYNLANLKTEEDFDYAIAGAGVGLTFFNGLSVNVSLAAPVSRNQFVLKNGFINLGFDIPIFDYISSLGNKKIAQ